MRLVIIGASGHGKVVADIAEKNGYDEIRFYDDNESIRSCGKWPVVGTIEKAMGTRDDVFIGIGDARIRETLMKNFTDCRFPVLIHPNAVVAADVEIGEGTVIMAGAVVNPGAKIGRGVILNTCSSVDHDCVIADFVHVSVGAHLSGTVVVGQRTWIAIGAIISNNITICPDCVIGAGAVVIKSIASPGIYVGVPAEYKANR